MLIKKPTDIHPSEITDKGIYLQRRRIIKVAVGLPLAALGSGLLNEVLAVKSPGEKLPNVKKGPFSTEEKPNAYSDITTYNNFYEFGTDKKSPAKKAGQMKTDPWTVTVEGECAKPGKFPLEDILKPHPLEERVYRFRCVEAWSMVVPWVGFPLADLIKRFEPTSKAKYVQFQTLFDPEQMPGQRRAVLEWPYVEGLRMDEAMNPLTLMVVGLYGEVLPNQNGAPLRLIVPWKYGFKSIKSIVSIKFTENQPISSWMKAGPSEYGFYSNVNPEVDHPRWSQKKERRLGDSFFAKKRKTRMFNGYAEQVAHLYKGMDLKKYF